MAPLKLAIQPEILDFHMPEPGVAHNLVIVRINKSFPGQGMKVINSFAHPSHKPPANQFYLTIDGYDYLVTVEFQDPR